MRKKFDKISLRALEVENISRPSELNDKVDIFFFNSNTVKNDMTKHMKLQYFHWHEFLDLQFPENTNDRTRC
jgi:hypothetical protein